MIYITFHDLVVPRKPLAVGIFIIERSLLLQYLAKSGVIELNVRLERSERQIQIRDSSFEEELNIHRVIVFRSPHCLR